MKNGLTKNDSLSIKGIAVLMLLFHHLFMSTDRFEGYTINFAPFSQDFIVNVAFLFKVCVSIFAFISGYGLLKSISKVELNRKNVLSWNITRLIKTMSGFWFVYTIVFIVTMLIDRLPISVYFSNENKLNGIAYIINDFLGLANLLNTPTLNSTWWYMSAAIVFILLVPVVYLISKKVGYLPIIVGICALPRLLKVGYPGGLNILTFTLPVIFGMVFADLNVFEKISERAPKNKIVAYIVHLLFFGGILIVGLFVPYMYDRTVIWEVTYGVIPVVFICLFRYCIIRIPLIKNVLKFLGEHSMTIFLSHTFLQVNYLNSFIYSKEHFVAIFIVLILLSLALALVLDAIKKLVRFDKLTDLIARSINKEIDKL